MSKLLIINAHPLVDSTTSFSLSGFKHFMKTYEKHKPNNEIIEQINLYEDEIPLIDKIVLGAWDKSAQGEALTTQEKEVTGRMNEILQQFKSANKYLIVHPLHNFNVPSKLKDYVDNIMIARETFKYTDTGSVGLLKDGRSTVVIQASGSIYTNDDWYTEVEYSHKYLKSMFNFFGIEDFQTLRVQGTALLDKDEILKKAFKEAEEAAVTLAKK
ncbi:FMN-dependent NADH-azoreductase [Paenibacillus agri]|uniref:FMN dependent NADH:quinone oxidoreductase n=1 Tax=Paenibacillus agri TaxID=2744309 RepID=A0A850EIL7_9BACL|nr:NAD(P)H-dependent oxidoreductase [Paenibacillus agri]NUU60216.1 NAD(P)H-dependent oxidoreductase [Paenibacillus agri]